MPLFSNHSSHSPAFFKYPPPNLQTNQGLTACVKQVANYPLPTILVNQEEKFSSARQSAADGFLSSYTIPLLAEPETLVQNAKLNWVLRFPLPTPNQMGTRRFSATPFYNHGPRTPQALGGALRFASSFTHDTPLFSPLPLPPSYSFLTRSHSLVRSGALWPFPLPSSGHTRMAHCRRSSHPLYRGISVSGGHCSSPAPPSGKILFRSNRSRLILILDPSRQLLLSLLRFQQPRLPLMLSRTSPAPPQTPHRAVELHAVKPTPFYLHLRRGTGLLHGTLPQALNQ